MEKVLKKLFYLILMMSIVIGFFIKRDDTFFWWHKIPIADAIFGGIGALLILMATKLVALFASKEEDFYD